MVLRLSRFGSGFRERVDRVRVFWSAQRGARIAVPRCSRVYIWSAKTRRLSVRVHQNHTLRSTLLTMQGGYGPLSLWRQHRCSSWRQTQCRDGQISSRQQQQQRTSLRQRSTRVYRPGCRARSLGHNALHAKRRFDLRPEGCKSSGAPVKLALDSKGCERLGAIEKLDHIAFLHLVPCIRLLFDTLLEQSP